MKIAYVTPRYGTEVVGGAEYAARMLAERVVSQLGWEVEALTSTALDERTWSSHFAPGEVLVNGVRVRRFATTGRHQEFPHTSWRILGRPKLAAPADQERWVDEQGPTSPDLVEAIADSDADLFAFYPYLYYPTVRGIAAAGRRAVLHPAAHDEAPIRLPIFARTFAAASGFVFQTDGERRLVESLFPVADRPQLLLGLGVDPEPGDVEGFRAAHGLADRPYLLALGRVDENKGAHLLMAYFAEYKRRHPGPLALAFVGPVAQTLPPHDDIVVTGVVSDEHKWGALRGAEVLVSPSPYEAFSLALIEGWAAGRPVLVNGACPATSEHVERSGGGLRFTGYATFESAIDRLVGDGPVARALAASGEQYVSERFRWPVLIERYGRFLERIAEQASASPSPSRAGRSVGGRPTSAPQESAAG